MDTMVFDHQTEKRLVCYHIFLHIPSVHTPHLRAGCRPSLNKFLTIGRLAAVNFFLAGVGVVQVSRILAYRRSLANSDTGVEAATEEVADTVREVAQETKEAAKKLV